MATIDVKDAAGATVALEKPLAPGRAAAAASRPVALSNEDAAFLDGIETKLDTIAADIVSATGPVGAGTEAAAFRVTLPTDGTGKVGLNSQAYSASATFTPAASSHVANDCNGAAGTFALAAPSAGRIMITSATLEIDGGTAEATAWRLYLYNVTPPSATADDGTWDLPSGDRASFLGQIDLGTAIDLGSTLWVETSGLNKQVKLAGTSLFGYLVNLTTLTPQAVAHIVTLHAVSV